MADQFDGMSDAELNDVIFNSDPIESETTGSGERDDSSVSPTIDESEEQPTETEVAADVDQSTDGEEDSEEESTEEDQTDDNDQETSEEDNETSKDDTEDGEDKGTESDNKESEASEKYQPLRANGKEYPIESIDELYKLASAGVGAQHKYQAIAGHKKTIMAAEKAGVDMMDAIKLMADYKENPQMAIMNLLKDNNIDPLDLDLDSAERNTKDYSISDFEAKYDEIVGEIGNSPVFPKVQELLVDGWDQRSRDIFLKDPEMIRNLHDEMTPLPGEDKSMYEIVAPIADKMKLSGDMRSDFEIYMAAREQKVQEFEKHSEAVAQVDKKPTVDKAKVKSKKKAAAPAKGGSTSGTTLDFAAMSDAELDAYLEKGQ